MLKWKWILIMPILLGGMLPVKAEILADLQIEESGTVANRVSGGVPVKLQGIVPAGSPIGESPSLNFAKAATDPAAYLELAGVGNPRSFSGSCALRISRGDAIGVLMYRRNKQNMWQFYIAPKGGRCHLFFMAWYYDAQTRKYQTSVELASPEPLPLNNPVHVGFLFDPDQNATLLINGSEVASAQPERPVVWGESDIRIGGDGAQRGLAAEIGDIRFGTGADGLRP